MCGRVDIHTPPSELARVLEAQLAAGVDPEGSPSWNVGPTKGLPAVVEDAESDTKILDIFRWGLVPHFMKDPKAGGYKMINARADSVATKPAYRQALQKRRCLVVVDGFYEWAVEDASLPKSKQTKQPYYFRRADGAPITFAGLYEFWTDKSGSGPGSEQGTVLQTCVIITTDAGPDMTDVHDRMPVIIEPADRDRWLDRTVEDVALITPLLVPSPGGTLVRHPVGKAVNSPRNDGPHITEPVDPDRSGPENAQLLLGSPISGS